MQGEKFTYKELNAVEIGPSVIDILHSVSIMYTCGTVISKKINNGNGVGKKIQYQSFPCLGI